MACINYGATLEKATTIPIQIRGRHIETVAIDANVDYHSCNIGIQIPDLAVRFCNINDVDNSRYPLIRVEI